MKGKQGKQGIQDIQRIQWIQNIQRIQDIERGYEITVFKNKKTEIKYREENV